MALEAAVAAEEVAVVIMATTSHTVVLTLPIIPITTFMLKVAAEAVDKAQVVMAEQVALVIVLMLMVTMVITAEHLLAARVVHMVAQAVQEQVNRVAVEALVDMAALIIMLVAQVVMDMVIQDLLVVDLAVERDQLVLTALLVQMARMEHREPQDHKVMLSQAIQSSTT